MPFSPPFVPSREPELIIFGLAALGFVLMCAYLMWSAARGLGTWGDVPAVMILVALAEVPMLTIGYGLRRARLKKLAEFREYRRSLASLAD